MLFFLCFLGSYWGLINDFLSGLLTCVFVTFTSSVCFIDSYRGDESTFQVHIIAENHNLTLKRILLD